MVRTVGETIELAPLRKRVKESFLKRGISPTEAAFNARNATVDFAKAGSTMKVIKPMGSIP